MGLGNDAEVVNIQEQPDAFSCIYHITAEVCASTCLHKFDYQNIIQEGKSNRSKKRKTQTSKQTTGVAPSNQQNQQQWHSQQRDSGILPTGNRSANKPAEQQQRQCLE